MNRVEQPNRWSCLPATFATVLGLDFGTIITKLGHDGSEVLFPELQEPTRRRGFHIQELIRLAWKLGWTTTQFHVLPQMQHGPHNRSLYDWSTAHDGVQELLAQASGVITGLNAANNFHAIAWDHLSGQTFDPARSVSTINSLRVESVWLLRQCLHKQQPEMQSNHA